jgi:hypothetical protein
VAAYSELFIEQYADFSTTIDVEDNQGDPIDFSQYSASAQFRKSYYSENAYFFDVEFDESVVGRLHLKMNGPSTGELSPGRYVYDIVVTDSDNYRTRVVEGIVVVTPGATRL